jgi:transketolase C-terminal domain/subunit
MRSRPETVLAKVCLNSARNEPNVVALCADLAESTRMLAFKEKFPDRYIELGVAEQNFALVASGLANYGKIPFIASYATFSPGRNNEQIRTNYFYKPGAGQNCRLTCRCLGWPRRRNAPGA